MSYSPKYLTAIADAAMDSQRVEGYTHPFYKYPARFSPIFASTVIEATTRPGDIVLDPFMGGGTTLVEASRLARKAVGSDINSLAAFVSKVKTTVLSSADISAIRAWLRNTPTILNIRNHTTAHQLWAEAGYLRHLHSAKTWPIRKLLELALDSLSSEFTDKQQNFIRCILLRTAQWALDCRKHIPSVDDFRKQLVYYADDMVSGIRDYSSAIRGNPNLDLPYNLRTKVLTSPASELDKLYSRYIQHPPKLILTSPPYPGVHVLYHRWQVHGRRETPTPYWIANCQDGRPTSYYTLGDRHQKELADYFTGLKDSYNALGRIATANTWLIQLVAFSEPDWQLPRMLHILQNSGFDEVSIPHRATLSDGRVWRNIPGRKFYTALSDPTPSGKEVLLVHRRARRKAQ